MALAYLIGCLGDDMGGRKDPPEGPLEDPPGQLATARGQVAARGQAARGQVASCCQYRPEHAEARIKSRTDDLLCSSPELPLGANAASTPPCHSRGPGLGVWLHPMKCNTIRKTAKAASLPCFFLNLTSVLWCVARRGDMTWVLGRLPCP